MIGHTVSTALNCVDMAWVAELGLLSSSDFVLNLLLTPLAGRQSLVTNLLPQSKYPWKDGGSREIQLSLDGDSKSLPYIECERVDLRSDLETFRKSIGGY